MLRRERAQCWRRGSRSRNAEDNDGHMHGSILLFVSRIRRKDRGAANIWFGGCVIVGLETLSAHCSWARWIPTGPNEGGSRLETP